MPSALAPKLFAPTVRVELENASGELAATFVMVAAEPETVPLTSADWFSCRLVTAAEAPDCSPTVPPAPVPLKLLATLLPRAAAVKALPVTEAVLPLMPPCAATVELDVVAVTVSGALGDARLRCCVAER